MIAALRFRGYRDSPEAPVRNARCQFRPRGGPRYSRAREALDREFSGKSSLPPVKRLAESMCCAENGRRADLGLTAGRTASYVRNPRTHVGIVGAGRSS